MADIYVSLALISLLALVLLIVGAWIGRRETRTGSVLISLAVLLAMVAYAKYVWYNVSLTSILPFSALIVLGNWFPLAAALLGGIAWGSVPGHWVRRGATVVALLAVGAYSAIAPILGRPPECQEVWADGVCQQTTSYTCTPACAATLLQMHDIATTEQEMAELCLTRKGTTWQGLYRGLKVKTANTPWDVEVVACSVDDLHQQKQGPMILMVGLEDDPESDIRYQTEDGWIPGVGHSVVMMESGDHRFFEIVDPASGAGREYWTADDVRALWRNYGMRLVRR